VLAIAAQIGALIAAALQARFAGQIAFPVFTCGRAMHRSETARAALAAVRGITQQIDANATTWRETLVADEAAAVVDAHRLAVSRCGADSAATAAVHFVLVQNDASTLADRFALHAAGRVAIHAATTHRVAAAGTGRAAVIAGPIGDA
jgi:hypothetical protein